MVNKYTILVAYGQTPKIAGEEVFWYCFSMFSSNEELTNYLIASGVLRSKVLVEAFKKVDRSEFVPPEFAEFAYLDTALPIGFGQTISQPTTVAFMLELLQPKKADKILDLGSGSGWTTALLASVAGPQDQVFGIEKVEALVKFGSENLEKYSTKAKILKSGEQLGLPSQAPFDRILVSASGSSLPQPLIDQLKNNGTLVLPVKESVLQIIKTPGGLIKREFPGFAFVPLKT